MSQPPTPYSRLFSFETFSSNNPTQPLPGLQVDNELNLIAQSLSATISRLNELQRADGKLSSSALDNTEIINTAKLAAYQATMAMLDSTIQSLNASAATAAQQAEDSGDSAQESAASAAASAASAQASAASATSSSLYAAQAEASYQSSTIASSLSAAAKLAAQAAALSAQSSASTATGTLSEALLLKTYLDTEYGDILQSWQNLNDVENKHQAREHLGVQGDVSHAALYHEFKTSLRYFRPPQAETDVDDADQLLRKWFGLEFNVTTDRFDASPDIGPPTVFTESGPIKWTGQGAVDLNMKFPNVAWDMSVDQRVDILRMKLRSFGVVMTNTMLFLRNERQGKYIWPCTKENVDQVSGGIIPGTEWTSVYSGGGRPWNWDDGVYGVRPHVTNPDENRFLTLEDFANAGYDPNNPQQIPYVTSYVNNLITKFVPYEIPQNILLGLAGADPSLSGSNPVITVDYVSQNLRPLIRAKLSAEINWTGDYDANLSYVVGSGVKYNGEWYVARDFEDPLGGMYGTIAPGQSPATNPELWTKLIPSGVGSGGGGGGGGGGGSNPFDQNLNTYDSPTFRQLGITSPSNPAGTSLFLTDTSLQMVFDLFNETLYPSGAISIAVNQGPKIELSGGGFSGTVSITPAGISFPDNTVQTTAAVQATPAQVAGFFGASQSGSYATYNQPLPGQYLFFDGTYLNWGNAPGQFDQSLNTTDYVRFADSFTGAGDGVSVKAGFDGETELSVKGRTHGGEARIRSYVLNISNGSSSISVSPDSGITFPDNTVQSTAAAPFDPSGLQSQINGKLTNTINWTGNYDNGVTYNAGDGVLFNGAGYILKSFIGGAGYDPGSYASLWTQVTPVGIGGNPFDQSLNSADGVSFSYVNASNYVAVNGATAPNGLTSTGLELNSAGTSITFSDASVQTTAFPPAGGTASQYIDGTGALQAMPATDVASRLETTVYNKTGSIIPKHSVVYIDGAHGNDPSIALAQANTEATSRSAFAFTKDDIPDQSLGTVVQAGLLEGVNTGGYADGDLIFLSPSVAGGWTSTQPYSPNHYVLLGTVVRAHPTQGTIQVKITNSNELDELSDVQVQGANDGDYLVKSGAYWTSGQLPTASTTQAGIARLATSAEAITGTDATRAVTPAAGMAAIDAQRVDIQTFGSKTTSGTFTWTKPAGAKLVQVRMVGGGGGGQSGVNTITANSRAGGNGGGGGAVSMFFIPASELGSTVTVIVGGGGAGGASVGPGVGAGVSGINGGFSAFGNYRCLYGNGATTSVGAGFAGTVFNIVNTTSSGAGAAGASGGGNTATSFISGQFVPTGGGGGGGQVGGSTISTNGGGGGSRTNSTPPAAYASTLAGGAGGNWTTSTPATNGTDQDVPYACGTGGGGGMYRTAVNGDAGGNGGWPGGGGGGGGACDSGYLSGKGGNGANGVVIVTTYF